MIIYQFYFNQSYLLVITYIIFYKSAQAISILISKNSNIRINARVVLTLTKINPIKITLQLN